MSGRRRGLGGEDDAGTLRRGGAEAAAAAAQPEVNVTPLVDVVLVLLIIFMVLAPVVSAEFAARLPVKDDPTQQALERATSDRPVVLQGGADGQLRINGVALEPAPEAAALRLDRVLNARPDRGVFVDAVDEAAYGELLRAVEVAERARAWPVVLSTEPVRIEPVAAAAIAGGGGDAP
jgi:biopolymer transport protein ExbD